MLFLSRTNSSFSKQMENNGFEVVLKEEGHELKFNIYEQTSSFRELLKYTFVTSCDTAVIKVRTLSGKSMQFYFIIFPRHGILLGVDGYVL